MADYEITAYRPDLRDQVVDLRRRSYQHEFPEAAVYLDWKYHRNPYLAEPLFYLALYDGRVVGMRGVYGSCWQAGASPRPFVIPAVDDFAIDRAHRDAGLASKIMRFALDDLARRGFDYVISTGAGRVTALSSLAMGWKSVGAMEPVARMVPSRRLWLRTRARLRRTPLLWRTVGHADAEYETDPHPFDRLDRQGAHVEDEPGSRIVVESNPRPETMAALAGQLRSRELIRHVRDATYLAWRYRHPVRAYRFLFHERNGEPDGYLVLMRYMSYSEPRLSHYVVDLAGTSASVREALLRYAIKRGRFSELGAWMGTRDDDDRALFAHLGFVESDVALRRRGLPCVLMRRIGPASKDEWKLGGLRVLDTANWDLRLIDSMYA